MANGSRRKRVRDYALGMIFESGWILAVTLLAFVMALIAKAIWR
ncbi:MAG TPA: hypothetical protein VF902_03940 [Coriobacteriia bacterium]